MARKSFPFYFFVLDCGSWIMKFANNFVFLLFSLENVFLCNELPLIYLWVQCQCKCAIFFGCVFVSTTIAGSSNSLPLTSLIWTNKFLLSFHFPNPRPVKSKYRNIMLSEFDNVLLYVPLIRSIWVALAILHNLPHSLSITCEVIDGKAGLRYLIIRYQYQYH